MDDDDIALLGETQEDRSTDREEVLRGDVDGYNGSITLLDDEVHITSYGMRDMVLSYYDILSWASNTKIWIIKYKTKTSNGEIHFYPSPPLTPQHCTDAIKSFVDAIMARNKRS
jgi:hypothetical protein